VALLAGQRTCDSQVAGSTSGWVPLRTNLVQATYTCVPLSPSSIIWCRASSHRQHDVSLLSVCHIIYLWPYCAGVTQYIFPLKSLPPSEDMRSSAAPAKKTTDLFI